jgi:hypothetical protein
MASVIDFQEPELLQDNTLPSTFAGFSMLYEVNLKTCLDLPDREWKFTQTFFNDIHLSDVEKQHAMADQKRGRFKALQILYKEARGWNTQFPMLYPSEEDWVRASPHIKEELKKFFTLDKIKEQTTK